MKEIKCLEEKAGKVFYSMKQNNKLSFSFFVKYWYLKWKEDFIGENGKCLTSKRGKIFDKELMEQFLLIYEKYKNQYCDKSYRQMKRMINKSKLREPMITSTYILAKQLGYRVFKADHRGVTYYNNRLSGFQIEKNGKAVIGRHYELSFNDVKEFLKKELIKRDGEQASNREESTTRTINIQQTKRNRSHGC